MKRTYYIIYTLLVGLFLVMVNCAKRGSPTGGDKDTTPPVMVRAIPPNNSTNFNTNKIRIYFDEYILLKDIRKQLIISPPLRQFPEITPQGAANKFIDIRISDTLQPNTTYVFNFGQSITDNNEGNPYHFFKYIFATGNDIDSLSVSGVIKDALHRNPDDFVSVMLYKADSTMNDSIIYKKPPTYITNTLDSTTAFTISNLKAGAYMLVAMKDVGNTYRFNQQTDKIAFKKEFIQVPSDTIYELILFKESPEYKMTTPSLTSRNSIIFGYQGNPDSITISLLTRTPENFKSHVLKDMEKDTLQYWFTEIEADSLRFKVKHKVQIDTFAVRLKKIAQDSLLLHPSTRGQLSLKETFTVHANIPLAAVDSSKIKLINKDSTLISVTTAIDIPTNQCRFAWDVQPNEKYTLEVLPGAITDFLGNVNDSIKYTLNTKSLADYGNIRVLLNNISTYPILVQLIKEKGTVVDEIYATSPRNSYEFRNLDPEKYYLRVIFDENENGKWDTGNYLEKRQPEPVHYYPSVINVRANWELEEVFTLE